MEFYNYRMSCPDDINPSLSYQMSFKTGGWGFSLVDHCANVLMKREKYNGGEIRTYLLQPG